MKKYPWSITFKFLGDALERLHEVLNVNSENAPEYLVDATIQRFEFVIELYWKTLKKILIYEKIESTTPRDIFSKAFQFKLIDNEKEWLTMLDDRNMTSHVYDRATALAIYLNIQNNYPVLEKTYKLLQQKYNL